MQTFLVTGNVTIIADDFGKLRIQNKSHQARIVTVDNAKYDVGPDELVGGNIADGSHEAKVYNEVGNYLGCQYFKTPS